MTNVFHRPEDLDALVGCLVGTSDWLVVDQKRIDLFAEATGDDQWIHIDIDRARDEMPGGKTIAHGYLLLSLLPVLFRQAFTIEKRSRSINYGSNKVRYLLPVPVDSRVRLKVRLKSADAVENGRRFVFEDELELEGAERPAMIAETISISYN
jgi:acyl dehydratase